MIVTDASAWVEVLLATGAGSLVMERMFQPEESWHVPHLLDLEIAQVLRRYCRTGQLSALRANEALDDLRDLPLIRYPHEPFLPRIWELRNSISAYDAAYVALAEALAAPLITRDSRLAVSRGHRAKIELIR